MAQVYEHSYLTIAATSATNGETGLFMDRNSPKKLIPGLYVQEKISHRHWDDKRMPYGALHGAIDKSAYPLLARGWCLQERLLATRILHFTYRGMVLECGIQWRYECEALNTDSKRRFSSDEPSQAAQLIKSPKAGAWYRIVTEYMRCSLTVRADILPALSGTAAKRSEAFPDEYFAGLWKHNILNDILWYNVNNSDGSVHQPRSGHTGPLQCLAPSFSWASTVGMIQFTEPSFVDNIHAQFLDGKCDVYGHHAFGQVSGGFIKLRGTPIRVVAENVDVDFDIISVESLPRPHLPWRLVKGRYSIHYRLHMDKRAIINRSTSLEVCYLPIASEELLVSTIGAFYCLILLENGNGTYSRIGFLALDF